MNEYRGKISSDLQDPQREYRVSKEHEVLTPANSFVFMDVEPASICWTPFFIPWKGQQDWFHAPGSLHSGKSVISFADGHAIIHKWKLPYNRSMQIQTLDSHPLAAADSGDVLWLRRNSHHKFLNASAPN
jgi:prepilin-type processing-associated H-X9-DG protein